MVHSDIELQPSAVSSEVCIVPEAEFKKGDVVKSLFSIHARLRALLVVGLTVASMLVMVNLGVDVLTASVPPWVNTQEEEPLRWMAKRDQLMSRVAGILGDYNTDSVDELRPLGVVLGFSTIARGVDPLQLDDADPAQRRWVNLATGGTGFFWLHQESCMFLSSGLRPEKVVIGIHPAYLVGRRPYLQSASTVSDIACAGLKSDHLKRAITDFCWTTRERVIVSTAIDNALLRARRRVMSGQPFEMIWTPVNEPWQSFQSPVPQQESAASIERQRDHFERMGWFDAERYRDTREQVGYLIDVVRRFRKIGSDVTVVIMPESSYLQKNIPAVAEQRLTDVLELAFPEQPVAVINLRAALADHAFRDNTHPNEQGRIQITSRLIREIFAAPVVAPHCQSDADVCTVSESRQADQSQHLSSNSLRLFTGFNGRSAEGP